MTYLVMVATVGRQRTLSLHGNVADDREAQRVVQRSGRAVKGEVAGWLLAVPVDRARARYYLDRDGTLDNLPGVLRRVEVPSEADPPSSSPAAEQLGLWGDR